MPGSQAVVIDTATVRKRQRKSKSIVFTSIGDCSVKVDVSSIPEYQRGQLAEFALDLTRKIFSIPGEEERYQAWLASKKAAEAAKRGGELIE